MTDSFARAPVALITGGARGLGRNTALHLAHGGVDVVVTYQSRQADADAVVGEIRAMGRKAHALRLDCADIASFPAFRQELSRDIKMIFGSEKIDFLINNAGIGINAPFEQTTPEQFDTLMAVHVKGVFFLTQALLPHINDGGKIITLSSGLARFYQPGFAAYAAMKGAVEVLTRYLAAELGPRRISVNCVAPGPIETDFGGGVVRDNAQVNAHLAARTAMGRVGQPDDVGGAIAALLTGETGWITGQRIEVSGGTCL